VDCSDGGRDSKTGTRFTEYLTTVLRLPYDNAKVTIDLYDGRLIYYSSYEGSGTFLGTILLQYHKTV